MSPDQSFGARFLAALRTQFKTTASLSYAVVEEVAQADRETFLAILFGRPEVPDAMNLAKPAQAMELRS